ALQPVGKRGPSNTGTNNQDTHITELRWDVATSLTVVVVKWQGRNRAQVIGWIVAYPGLCENAWLVLSYVYSPALEVSLTTKPPAPPFTYQSAVQKIRGAEDAWNGQDPEKVALAYTLNSWWRNRNTFLQGRDEII